MCALLLLHGQDACSGMLTPPNIQIICAFAFFFHCGWSVWERNIFPIWLSKATGSGLDVGYIQGMQGLLAVVSGPLIGIAIDTYSRQTMKIFVVVEGIFSLGAVFFSLYTFRMEQSWILYVAIGFWGILLSAQGTFMDTLIADFSEKGKERTALFALKSTWWRIGGLFGQIIIWFFSICMGTHGQRFR